MRVPTNKQSTTLFPFSKSYVRISEGREGGAGIPILYMYVYKYVYEETGLSAYRYKNEQGGNVL